MKFISFNLLELQESTKEGRIVSRKDRKQHANCNNENAKDGKPFKPEERKNIVEDDAKTVIKTTKNIGKRQDIIQMKGNSVEGNLTKPAVSLFGELYLLGFSFV